MNIPKDRIESGSGIRGWVNATFYAATAIEVTKKINDYFDLYPPQGYDTYITNAPRKTDDGYYWGAVRRYSTCD